jgi:hypothetical protein
MNQSVNLTHPAPSKKHQRKAGQHLNKRSQRLLVFYSLMDWLSATIQL